MKVRKTRIIDRHSWHGGYEGLFPLTYSCRAHQNVLLTLTCWQSFGGLLQLNFSNCVSSGWMETLKMCLNKQADMQTRLVRISSVSVLRPWALPPLSTTEHCKRGIYGSVEVYDYRTQIAVHLCQNFESCCTYSDSTDLVCGRQSKKIPLQMCNH